MRWSWVMLAAATAIGCAPMHADDGFRARLAAGCDSRQACDALVADARGRFTRCANDPRTGRRGTIERVCADEVADRTAAELLQMSAARSETVAVQTSARSERERYEEARRQFEDDYRRLGDSCEDIEAIERAGAAASPYFADRYHQLAASRRKSRVGSLTMRVEHRVRAHRTDLQSVRDLEDLKKQVEEVKGLTNEMRCYGAESASLQAEADAWIASTDAAIADEEKCRASADCVGGRAAAAICRVIADKQNAVKELALERANPSGFVDARLLHDLGERIQDDDARIADLRGRFTSITKRTFSASVCR